MWEGDGGNDGGKGKEGREAEKGRRRIWVLVLGVKPTGAPTWLTRTDPRLDPRYTLQHAPQFRILHIENNVAPHAQITGYMTSCIGQVHHPDWAQQPEMEVVVVVLRPSCSAITLGRILSWSYCRSTPPRYFVASIFFTA